MINKGIRSIPLRNKELIEILNSYVKLRTDDQESFDRYLSLQGKDKKAEDWTSEEYLKEVISQGEDHCGYPDALRGMDLKVNDHRHMIFDENTLNTPEKYEWRKNLMHNIKTSNHRMWNWMGCRNQALTAYYPPEGFIAWHNNANAAAWNFIFTYSETGEGHFKYWDIEKQEIVYMYDKPGWQCKAGYFGRYTEPESVFYHAAETKCWRQTVSFCFDEKDISEEYREDIIHEIMSE